MSVYNGTYKEDIFNVRVSERVVPGLTKFVINNAANFHMYPTVLACKDDVVEDGVYVFEIQLLNQVPTLSPSDHLSVLRKMNLDLILKVPGSYENAEAAKDISVPTQNS